MSATSKSIQSGFNFTSFGMILITKKFMFQEFNNLVMQIWEPWLDSMIE